jgi:hypothetical protein
MTDNKAFFILYPLDRAVKVETHYERDKERERPLADVCDLICGVY